MGTVKKRHIAVFLVGVAIVAAIIYGVVVKPDRLLPTMTTMQDLVNKALVARKPMVFLIYPPDQKNVWDAIQNDPQFADTFEKMLLYRQPQSFFTKTKWNQQLKGVDEPVLLAVDYRNRLISMHKGLPATEQLQEIFDNALSHHEQMLEHDAAAKKELDSLKTIIEEQRYIEAVDRLRTYLMVYESTESERQARDLLNEISTKPQVIEHLRSNRDVSNRKVLLYKAQEDFRFKRYFNAYRAIALLTQQFPQTEESKEAASLKEQIDTIAREEFKEASLLYERKQFYQAFEKYMALHEKFQGTHWDVYVSGKIQQLEADPEFTAYKEKRAKDREMESVFDQAERLFEQEKWDQAEQFYNTILRFYPKSRYAFRSKQRIEQMNTLRYSKPPQEYDNTSDAKEE